MKLIFTLCLVVFLITQVLCGPARNATGPNTASNDERNELSSVSKAADTSGQKKTEDEVAETKFLSQKLLDSLSDFREYFADKINEIYAILNEIEKSADLINMNVDHVPHFTDPFYVGNFNKTYKLADLQYTDIKVYGMSNFKSYDISINETNRKANITLVANQLRIEGNYRLSNFLKHTGGKFDVKLLDNVTYNERDLYYKFKNDVDVASAEATMTYGRSESNYENIGLLAHLFKGVISNKLTEEILYRVGREIGYKIRYVTTSKIGQVCSQVSHLAENNRIVAIIKSVVSEIRTLLNKSDVIVIPLQGLRSEIKVRKNFFHVSNITIGGLNTVHLKNDVKVLIRKDDVSISFEGEGGPLVISGLLHLMEEKHSKLVSLTVPVEYYVTNAQAKFNVSNMLRNDQSFFQTTDMEVKVSQPAMKMKSDQLKVKEEDLQKLAQLLKPDIESELNKWLRNFINEIFRPTKSNSDAQIESNTR